MSDRLDRDDWERVLHALSQFRHNPQYRGTYEKVYAILSELGSG